MIIFIVFVMIFFHGIFFGNTSFIFIGGIPLLFAIIGFALQRFGEITLEKEMENNPEIREICKDIDRHKRNLGL